MKILCKLEFHTAAPSSLWNDGHYFSVCTRCGQNLIRTSQSRWIAVPPHMKVVWRERTSDDVVWPSHVR